MFATIYLPNFCLQAAMRHQPELCKKPIALIEEHERKPVIIQLNEAAESAGIRKGMTPSQALARSLQVVIKVRAPAHEKSMQKIFFTTRLLSALLWKTLCQVFAQFSLRTAAI